MQSTVIKSVTRIAAALVLGVAALTVTACAGSAAMGCCLTAGFASGWMRGNSLRVSASGWA